MPNPEKEEKFNTKLRKLLKEFDYGLGSKPVLVQDKDGMFRITSTINIIEVKEELEVKN